MEQGDFLRSSTEELPLKNEEIHLSMDMGDQSPIDVFKLHPVKMSIPGSSFAVATMTFTPPDKKKYSCTFKASLVIPKGGKGHVPQVTFVCPKARSNTGNSLLRFKRLQLGESEMLPLLVRNKGVIPVEFMLHLEDEHGAFFLKGRDSTLERFCTEDVEEDSAENENKSSENPFLLLHPGQSTKFDVIFEPTLAQRLEGRICVVMKDKHSKKSPVKLVGEGHKDEFALDGLEEDTQERDAKSILKKNIIDAVRVNHIQFGNRSVGESCRKTFTITNHTCTKVMRFEWEEKAPFQFSPKVGHLHPGCAKGITVTLKSDVPATFRRHLVKCKVTEINLELPKEEVQDWDDQMCIVTWNDTTREDSADSWPDEWKVVEKIPEPAHTVVEESSQEAEVYLSASVVYSQVKLSTVLVQFKDTLLFQTRKAILRMHNTGKVDLEYSWKNTGDSKTAQDPYLLPLLREYLFINHKYPKLWQENVKWQQERPSQRLLQLWELYRRSQDYEEQQEQPEQQNIDLMPEGQLYLKPGSLPPETVPEVLPLFSISPPDGIIAPGKMQTFQVGFYPMTVGKFMALMLCRIPNLEPAQKRVWMIVKGRALERKIRR
ncbi:hypothetical protein HGM15179_020109 [Zosterops borbonicus]|uniref:HYDIN n=1 Tax=Zosterops borbonicus TaxID=364589 RepID=A0A8K1FUG7_9PASS|nr:hypothetical protein HGM15179_020109 [Zosterops borbonicus]